jgi:hypothetical protein
MPDDIPTPPPDLFRAFRDKEVVLYAGAGLSYESGFPLWPQFVKSLVEFAVRERAVDKSFAVSLFESLQIGKSDFVADSVVSALRERQPGKLEGHLQQVFLRPTLPLSPIHEEIRKLNLRAVMTTNFDDLLERTFSDRAPQIYAPQETEQLLNAISKQEFFILKLYGSVLSPDVLVAPAQYEEVIRGNRAFSSVIETLFFSSTILFVGASLEGIEAYLRGISLPGVQKRTHYAVVAVSGSAWRTTADILRRRYGIEVLPIGDKGHIGGRVLSFVKQLTAAIPAPASAPAPQTREVTRVTLQNIGPFESLELQLDRKWNVLLGDNGVGKSSILRAIAAALVGPQAPYVDRLMKAGTSRAEITIDIGKKTYKTELFRGTGGRVEVVSHLSPIEAEGVLALGFPALRTVSWTRPKGPTVGESPSTARPNVADLAPLIGGGLDPRTDDLKQWIVSMDYRSRALPPSTEPHGVLRTFFEVAGVIAEGMKLEFVGVDPETYDVKIQTADGPLPLEALSQGTISLLGWIGMLVQRLSEVFGGRDMPLTDRPAIVLIDEIDAHLHPAWQQILVDHLSSEFPNVQFIATTHSPLIVGGMRASQVFRFLREDDDTIVQVQVEEEMTVGRTDQILTGELFGLDTTLDTDTQKLRDEYRRLLARRSRAPHEEKRFLVLEDALAFRIPSAAETPVERQAYKMLELLLRRSAGDKNPEMQMKVLDAGRKLLDTLSKKTAAPAAKKPGGRKKKPGVAVKRKAKARTRRRLHLK